MTLRHPVCVSERDTLKETCMFRICSLGGHMSREHCIWLSKKANVERALHMSLRRRGERG